MSDREAYVVNNKNEYHDCEMVFSFYFENSESDFQVDPEQLYKINTTLKEVAIFNEALQLFQSQGFKEKYLLYTSVQDGSQKYPNFVIDYIDSVELTKQLQSLSNDEDSLVQLNEYCLETPPTYVDDFYINKRIHSIKYKDNLLVVDDFDDIESFVDEYLSV